MKTENETDVVRFSNVQIECTKIRQQSLSLNFRRVLTAKYGKIEDTGLSMHQPLPHVSVQISIKETR
mgnify:FL=1